MSAFDNALNANRILYRVLCGSKFNLLNGRHYGNLLKIRLVYLSFNPLYRTSDSSVDKNVNNHLIAVRFSSSLMPKIWTSLFSNSCLGA